MLATVLVACGGGGGDEDPLIAQGRYTTASGVTPAYTVLVVPASAGAHQAWAVSSEGDRLAKLSLSATNAVTGKRYDLSANALTPTEAVTGTATLAGPASSASLSLPGLATLSTTATQVTRTDRLTETTTLATISGTWSGSFDAGVRTATWTINGSGALSGFSSTGCTYTGSFTARNDSPVFDVSFTQTCGAPTSTVTSFSGIARQSNSAGSNRLTVVAVSTDESTPWVSLFSAGAI